MTAFLMHCPPAQSMGIKKGTRVTIARVVPIKSAELPARLVALTQIFSARILWLRRGAQNTFNIIQKKALRLFFDCFERTRCVCPHLYRNKICASEVYGCPWYTVLYRPNEESRRRARGSQLAQRYRLLRMKEFHTSAEVVFLLTLSFLRLLCQSFVPRDRFMFLCTSLQVMQMTYTFLRAGRCSLEAFPRLACY